MRSRAAARRAAPTSASRALLAMPAAGGHNQTRTMADDERPTILLVDDNAQVREMLSRFLGERYEVLQAEDGQAAVEAVRARPDLDVLVTDVSMPAMDGLQLARTVRRRWPSLPVVIITGLGREE